MAADPWTQLGADIDGQAAGDYSGYSVSLSSDGSIVAIGSIYNNEGGTKAGQVRVFEFDGSNWNQLGANINGEAAEDESAHVALSSDGTILAIGGARNDATGNNAGHVRVFEFDGSAWNQLGADINGEAANDQSGKVALSSDGTILAIGASLNDDNGVDSGHVRVFQYLAGTWSQLGTDIDGSAASDNFGSSVALSGDGTVLAVGAPNSAGGGSARGSAAVFEYDGSVWNQRGVDLNGEADNDKFGVSVSLNDDGSIVAIGANLNDGGGGNSGHARVFTYDGSSWNQAGSDIDGEGTGDKSGISVALSASGSILAVGAQFNTNGVGFEAGHVRVHEFSGGAWIPFGDDIDGEAPSSNFGCAISLSSDGKIVAIGGTTNHGAGTSAGHVQIYEAQFRSSTPTSIPTSQPTTVFPTSVPTSVPTSIPTTALPTSVPTSFPTSTLAPSPVPTVTHFPSLSPTITHAPSSHPTISHRPTSSAPTSVPTEAVSPHIFVHAIDLLGDGWGDDLYLAVVHNASTSPEPSQLYSLNCACKVIRLFSRTGSMVISVYRNTSEATARFEWEVLWTIGYSDGVSVERFDMYGDVNTQIVIEDWSVVSSTRDLNAKPQGCSYPPPKPKPTHTQSSNVTSNNSSVSNSGPKKPPAPAVMDLTLSQANRQSKQYYII